MSWWDEEADDGETGKAPLLILYGDQAAAMSVNTAAMGAGIISNASPLKLFLKAGFLASPVVLLCADGVPLDAPFFKLLDTAGLPSDWLRGMHHSSIASDPSCPAAVKFNARLADLGSKLLFPTTTPAALSTKWAHLPDDTGARPSAKLPERPQDAPAAAPPAAPPAAATPPPAPAAAPNRDVVFDAEAETLLVRITLEKSTDRLGPRFEQSDGNSNVVCKAVKKDTVCDRLGVEKGMRILQVDGEDVTGEAGLQKQIEALRGRLQGTLLFRVTDEHAERLSERYGAAAAAATTAPAAEQGAPQQQASTAPSSSAGPPLPEGCMPNYAERTLLIKLTLSKVSERLGMRHEQNEGDNLIYVTAVKKGTLCDTLGVQVGMQICCVDGAPIEGEISLQKAIDKLRSNLGGTITFKVPSDVEFDDPAQVAPPHHTLPEEKQQLASRLPPGVHLPATKKPIVFMYASETGNAESICLDLNRDTREKGWPTRVGKMNEFESLKWDADEGGVVLVVSTTGDGEIPDNGRRFLRYLKKSVGKREFPGVKYALLALGDQNYDKFCGAGKAVDRFMEQVGCKRLCESGLADDGTGLEIVVEPWRKQLQDKLLIANGFPDPNEAKGENPYVRVRKSCASERKVLILYGSETGNAQAIARNIYEVCVTSNMSAQLIPANEFKKVDWEGYPVVILIMATTGDGGVCNNAMSFHGFINRNSHPPGFLDGMQYTVLCLGDRSYPKFCNAGKLIDERMAQLGAARFHPTGYADDEVGLEVVVEPWKQKLWPAMLSIWTGDQLALSPSLQEVLRLSPKAGPQSQGPCSTPPPLLGDALGDRREGNGLAATPRSSNFGSHAPSGPPYPRAYSDKSSEISYEMKHGHHNPFYAKVVSYSLLADVPDTPTYKLTLDVSEGGIEWAPGDAIGVCPSNDEAQVDYLLKRMGVPPHDDFQRPTGATAEEIKMKTGIYESIRFPLTNKQVLLRHVDLFIRRTDTLRFLANSCTDKTDKEVLASWCVSGTKLFRDRVLNKKLTMSYVLEHYPSCVPDFRGLVERCAMLQPRYYSVASAMVVSATQLDICFRVVTHSVGGSRAVPGVSTHWMLGLIKSFDKAPSQISLPVFLKTTPEFSPPEDVSTPLIMIGPGTGVAPFIAFLQYRAWQIASAGEEQQGGVLHEGSTRVDFPAAGGQADEAVPLEQSAVVGESHLFFGCRTRTLDYLFREDLEAFEADKTLRYLHTAFSQEEEDAYWYGGVYVQDKMMAVSGRLASLIMKRNAYVYVCGDAKSMAKDVHRYVSIVPGSCVAMLELLD
eukprot:TRINITY_DN6879_c0_g1_i4.p1 TRINITY_DN6879_c0_g1~~TRINITY_DN6879_c0_g1_i4.p1  ORF type:complete len:1292 (+),score=424.77 TRINITY_DN6879_c0_g1_i4:157-4032(+)